jgi:hypothetical protein
MEVFLFPELPSPFLLILFRFLYDLLPPYLPMPLREFPEVPFDFARYRV